MQWSPLQVCPQQNLAVISSFKVQNQILPKLYQQKRVSVSLVLLFRSLRPRDQDIATPLDGKKYLIWQLQIQNCLVPLYQPVPLPLLRHVRSDCPYAHNFQDYRRDPKKINYTVTLLLFSLKLVPTGPKDKLNLLKIQDVLSGWNAQKVTAGLRRSFILILKNGKLANQKKFRSNKFNRSLLSAPNRTYIYSY